MKIKECIKKINKAIYFSIAAPVIVGLIIIALQKEPDIIIDYINVETNSYVSYQNGIKKVINKPYQKIDSIQLQNNTESIVEILDIEVEIKKKVDAQRLIIQDKITRTYTLTEIITQPQKEIINKPEGITTNQNVNLGNNEIDIFINPKEVLLFYLTPQIEGVFEIRVNVNYKLKNKTSIVSSNIVPLHNISKSFDKLTFKVKDISDNLSKKVINLKEHNFLSLENELKSSDADIYSLQYNLYKAGYRFDYFLSKLDQNDTVKYLSKLKRQQIDVGIPGNIILYHELTDIKGMERYIDFRSYYAHYSIRDPLNINFLEFQKLRLFSYPNDIEILQWIIKIYLNNNEALRIEECEKYLNKAIKIDEYNHENYYLKAYYNYIINDLNAATKSIEKAISINNNIKIYWLLYSDIFVQLKLFSQAENILLNAFEIFEDNKELKYMLIKICVLEKDNEKFNKTLSLYYKEEEIEDLFIRLDNDDDFEEKYDFIKLLSK